LTWRGVGIVVSLFVVSTLPLMFLILGSLLFLFLSLLGFGFFFIFGLLCLYVGWPLLSILDVFLGEVEPVPPAIGVSFRSVKPVIL